MLSKLYIRNFALIQEIEIQLGSGLNILTGETGAGKSLLLGAIGLILGKRVDYSMIFDPSKKCIVEATFGHLPEGILTELATYEEFDLEDGEGMVTIRREASPSGKSRAFINDTPVSLGILKEVTSLLVDLHGQHENQRLLSPDQQIRLLDQFAGVSDKVAEFRGHLRQWKQYEVELERLQEEESQTRQQQDYFTFQFKELEAARLEGEDEEALEQQLNLLENAEGIQQTLSQSTAGLYDDEHSVYNRLSELLHDLENISGLDAEIAEQYERLSEARYTLEEASRSLDKVRDRVETDPETLQAIEERVNELNKLKMKFNARDLEELISIRDDFGQKIGRFDSLGADIDLVKGKLVKLEKDMVKLGLAIEKKRKSVAGALKKDIDQLMTSVGLDNASFEVEIGRPVSEKGRLTIEGEQIKAGNSGINTVDFKIRTNKGMPMGSLNQVASGGEISRVMLAIKAALASKAELSALIFDEIDTGISGEIANKVGRVMRQLGNNYQLIAITHLPQIAGKGHQHFKIFKEVKGETTVTDIRPLDNEGRVLELAKMLSGEHPSESAIRNAKELISSHN